MPAHTLPALLLLLACATAHAQTLFEDKTHHWTLQTPDGWEPAPQTYLDNLNADLDKRKPNRNYRFIAQFHPKDPTDDSPYLLVQFTDVNVNGSTYQEIEHAFGARSAREPDPSRDIFGPKVIGYIIGTPILDRQNNRIYMDTSVTRPDGEEIQGRSIICLASHGLVQLNFYAPKTAFSDHTRMLGTFDSSFRLDPAYAPRIHRSPGLGERAALLVTGLIPVSFVIWLIIVITRRKTRST